MTTLLILIGISFVGILVVFWLLKNEDKPSLRNFGAPPAVVKPPVTPKAKKPSILAGLFSKFKKEKKETKVEVPLPSVTDFVEKSFVVYQDKPEADPDAPQATLSAAEEKKIEQEIDLAARSEEWKGKYERLDKLFNEKSAALTKSEEFLQNELSNRKEFNKLKDMLEKELREAKDKARNVQVELNAARTETEGGKKRIAQLEEKIIKMEKAILEKDDEVADLAKRLQAAASIPPVTAAAPEFAVEFSAAPAAPEVTVQPGEVTVEPETNGNEPSQSPYPVLPESNSQDTQSKPISEGQTDQQDEQKKE